MRTAQELLAEAYKSENDKHQKKPQSQESLNINTLQAHTETGHGTEQNPNLDGDSRTPKSPAEPKSSLAVTNPFTKATRTELEALPGTTNAKETGNCQGNLITGPIKLIGGKR